MSSDCTVLYLNENKEKGNSSNACRVDCCLFFVEREQRYQSIYLPSDERPSSVDEAFAVTQ